LVNETSAAETSAVETPAAKTSPGIDFTNLHFGPKTFLTPFHYQISPNLHPKAACMNLAEYCGQ
jgi:hypothetical protein